MKKTNNEAKDKTMEQIHPPSIHTLYYTNVPPQTYDDLNRRISNLEVVHYGQMEVAATVIRLTAVTVLCTTIIYYAFIKT